MTKFAAYVRAIAYGVRDGWEQPYQVDSSRNVDHLFDTIGEDAALTWEDRGINIGQFLREGRKSQAYSEGYWPFKR